MPATAGVLECEEVDTIFAMAEQKVTDRLIRFKMVTKNAYYGKIPDGKMFPLKSGTRIKGFKLGRIGIPNCTGWRPVQDELCSTNACSFEPDVIQHGHDDYFFSLVQKDLRTDWLCIDSLALREMAEEEVMHLEEGLQLASRYVHEEFRRSRYLLFGKHKLLGVLPNAEAEDFENSRACENSMTTNAYVFETRDNGEIDECHIRVRVPVASIPLISELTLDQLDYASIRLEYEDEMFMNDFGLFDVLLADKRVSNRLALQEDEDMRNSASQGGNGWSLVDLRQTYGTERVLRNYSLRTDIHAMRFYADTEFNATLDPFDEDVPETWPRFERVFPYVAQKAGVAGVHFVTNENYLNAPFGISTIMNTRVMDVMSFPNVVRVGGAAKVGGFGYEGTAQWQNPDWPCNVNRDKGFWKMRFRLAARQNRDEQGYSWFHRIDRRMRLVGNPCPLPTKLCTDEVTAYCFSGMGGEFGDSGNGENRAIDQGI